MEIKNSSPEFNINELTDSWINRLKSTNSFTEADCGELKSHLQDSIDELKKAGLDDQEAFIVAKKRLGDIDEWKAEFEEMNKGIIQMRRSVIILSGVLAYFLIYYFLLFTSKSLFLAVSNFGNSEFTGAITWVKRYLITAHFLLILLLTSVYLFENRIMALFDRIKLRPGKIVALLALAVGFTLGDTCVIPYLNKTVRANISVKYYLYDVYLYFDYSFPLLFCIGFVILYQRYFKKAKINF